MDLTSKPKLSTVTYVLNFKAPDTKIRFRQADAESAFSGFVNGQSQQTNVPDSADPVQARIMFGTDTKSVAISQITCQLNMRFGGSGLDFDSQLQTANKNVQEFFQRAESFAGSDGFQQSGLVYQVALASTAPVDSLHDYLFTRFYALPRLGRIAAAQVLVGYEIDDLYLTVGGSVYENRKMEIPPGVAGAPVFIDVSTLPVVEYGLEFKIDINDRPRQKHGQGFVSPPAELLTRGEEFIRTKFEAFSGFKI